MADGGVTAIGFDGNIVGVSKPVAKEDGWLEFPRPDENGTPGSPAKVYCKLVSSNKTLVSVLTDLDCVAFGPVQHKPAWCRVRTRPSSGRR